MYFFKTLFSFLLLFVAFTAAEDTDALRDIQIGLQGLAEAGKDPAMLAQLIRDMQVRSKEPREFSFGLGLLGIFGRTKKHRDYGTLFCWSMLHLLGLCSVLVS